MCVPCLFISFIHHFCFFYISCVFVSRYYVAHDFPTREKTDSSLCPPPLRRVKVKSPSFFFPLLCFFVFFLLFFFLQSGLEIATRISTGSISDRASGRRRETSFVRARKRAEIAPGSFRDLRDRRERSTRDGSSIFGIRGWEKGSLSGSWLFTWRVASLALYSI